ncbi:MAG: hypothetical protein O3A63_18735 [Proteobacteria bacterium]|nr:hypothetical protein [Pseudomonadota bacterium]
MKNVLVIIAPFGFGPASKGLYIAEQLSGLARLTLTSSGDAYDFIIRHAPIGTVCRSGRVNQLFTATEVSTFDLIISVNNGPSITSLTRIGLGPKVVFVDSLMHWRAGQDEIVAHQSILAYLVQDFPGAAKHPRTCQSEIFELVAPMVWRNPDHRVAGDRHGALLCLGGVTSALVRWQDINEVIEGLVEGVLVTCRGLNLPLTVIGNDSLKELKVAQAEGISIRGAVDPHTSSDLIAGSLLLLTTPGIGTVYEGFIAATPVMLMPHNNSTQLHQYRTLADLGIAHTLHNHPDLASLYQISDQPWNQHAAACTDWLKQHTADLQATLQRSISGICDPQGRLESDALLQTQAHVVDSLSKVNVIEVLKNLIETRV